MLRTVCVWPSNINSYLSCQPTLLDHGFGRKGRKLWEKLPAWWRRPQLLSSKSDVHQFYIGNTCYSKYKLHTPEKSDRTWKWSPGSLGFLVKIIILRFHEMFEGMYKFQRCPIANPSNPKIHPAPGSPRIRPLKRLDWHRWLRHAARLQEGFGGSKLLHMLESIHPKSFWISNPNLCLHFPLNPIKIRDLALLKMMNSNFELEPNAMAMPYVASWTCH